ncbi:MAG: sulfurtransferase TusA family protein [Armatimonadota bacterium]|jgi:tRNA 2-thiouridine synthesizing protein A
MTSLGSEAVAVAQVDLTGEVCPMTFVRTKLHLEKLSPGDLIELVLKPGEQMRNVPQSLKAEGHRIEKVTGETDRFHLIVRKGS